MNRRSFIGGIVSAVCGFGLIKPDRQIRQAREGQTKRYVGGDGGRWGNPGCWSPRGVPTEHDNCEIYLAEGQTMLVDNATCDSLTIAGSGTLVMWSGHDFLCMGEMTIQGDGGSGTLRR